MKKLYLLLAAALITSVAIAKVDYNQKYSQMKNDRTVKDDMPVKNTSGGIGNGLVKIVSVYKDGVKPCNGSSVRITCSFEELGHLGINRRGISSCNGRLSARKPYLTLGHRKTRE